MTTKKKQPNKVTKTLDKVITKTSPPSYIELSIPKNGNVYYNKDNIVVTINNTTFSKNYYLDYKEYPLAISASFDLVSVENEDMKASLWFHIRDRASLDTVVDQVNNIIKELEAFRDGLDIQLRERANLPKWSF